MNRCLEPEALHAVPRVDERIAVAVAADPASHAREAIGRLGIGPFERRRERMPRASAKSAASRWKNVVIVEGRARSSTSSTHLKCCPEQDAVFQRVRDRRAADRSASLLEFRPAVSSTAIQGGASRPAIPQFAIDRALAAALPSDAPSEPGEPATRRRSGEIVAVTSRRRGRANAAARFQATGGRSLRCVFLASHADRCVVVFGDVGELREIA